MASQKDPPYIRTEFELEAVFKHRSTGRETVFKDIVAMSATFALNTIPTASLDVATGLEVHTEQRATIHDVIEELEPRDRCVVYLTIKSTDGHMSDPITHGMYNGKFIVFDGYYAGIGYQRGHNHCTYTIHLIHWLDDLNCSSMLNGDWSPHTPSDLAQATSQIALNTLTGGGGADEAGGKVQRGQDGACAVPLIDPNSPDDDNALVTVDNMEDDLWEKVIKRTFEAICSLQHPIVQCGDIIPSSVEPPPEEAPGAEPLLEPGRNNKAAWEALRRMPGNKLPDKYRAKLPLNMTGYTDGEPFAFISLSAHKGLTHMLSQGIGYNTFWSKLIGEIAPSFLFAISPSVTFAQAIPFFPGLHTPYITITGEEYNYANFTTNCAHMVSCVLLKWPSQPGPPLEGDMGAISSYCEPPGFYPKNPIDYTHHWGNILIREPPMWLADPVYTESYPRENNFNYEGRSAFAPQRGSDQNPEAPMRPQEIEAHIRDAKAPVDGENLTIYDRFACHLYKSAILGQRYGELSGKLRFDIAPGSIVEVEPPITAVGKENTSLYGAVVQVSFAINAEQHTAGTSFSFSHVRTKRENDIKIPDSKTHYVGTVAPLYKDAKPGAPWPGGPLVIGQEPGGNSGANAPIDYGAPGFGGIGGTRTA